ncbi:arp2/3 complex-activating protein rickA [Uranotaenia lowii]|uniref:arp2/3 complex-activating protein rickA n=1 Tax=Uranotaenia lowii TaxID=190385 RepID=UPI002479F494|nr:arp2/3 complex-activating protein rickA [Uranotaenia lowii]
MDKSVGKDKRRQDKAHKKPHPVKQKANKIGKPTKEVAPVPAPEPLIDYDDRFSKRPIESNFNCDLPSSGSDSEDEQQKAADFEKLLQIPASTSGHFFLSSEKHWVKEAQEPSIASGKTAHQYGQYFKIDTAQLNLGLVSIPLHERNHYPVDIFTSREIDILKLKAELESQKYIKKYKSSPLVHSKLKTIKMNADSNFGSENAIPPQPIPCLIGPDALPVEPIPPQPFPCLIGPDALPAEPIPPQPIPCLIGPDALPAEPIPPQPYPCLIGPDAFPGGVNPLRPTPCLIGPSALPRGASDSTTAVSGISERMSSVKVSNSSATDNDVVPIDNGESSVDNKKESGKNKPTQGGEQRQTKEDMQQWLDDILEM